MTKRCTATLFALVAALGSLQATAAETSKPVPNDYQVLLNRSIFSREPVRRERPAERARELPDLTPVLTGIVQDGEEFIAFLEDPRTGKVALARTGEQTTQGTIEQITLNYLELRPANAADPIRIELGHTLKGTLRTVATPTPAATPASSVVNAGNPAPAPTAGEGMPAFTLDADGNPMIAPPSPPTPAGPSTPATPAAGTPAPPAAPAATPASSDPAERLRQRRLRELQGK